jgi:outer membrane immunogenic protein
VRTFLFFGFLLLATTSALAQPAGVPLASWSGPYAGLNVGYAGGHSDQTDSGIPTPAPAASSASPSASAPSAISTTAPPFIWSSDGGTLTLFRGNPPVFLVTGDGHYSVGGGMIGGTLGYNWQRGRWLFGLEGDYAWADVAGSSSACGSNSAMPHPCGTRLDSLGAFRGRIGYAVGATGSLLPYLIGGLALGDVRGWNSLISASGTCLRPGWTAGAGIEAMIDGRSSWNTSMQTSAVRSCSTSFPGSPKRSICASTAFASA